MSRNWSFYILMHCVLNRLGKTKLYVNSFHNLRSKHIKIDICIIPLNKLTFSLFQNSTTMTTCCAASAATRPRASTTGCTVARVARQENVTQRIFLCHEELDLNQENNHHYDICVHWKSSSLTKCAVDAVIASIKCFCIVPIMRFSGPKSCNNSLYFYQEIKLSSVNAMSI